VEEYKQAFTKLSGEMTDQQYEMLRLHYRAPEHTSSASQMAETMKWGSLGAANLHYGRFAACLRHLLNRSPEYNVELLCSFDDHNGEIVWVMHENVARALEELAWI
jgi:hypothetical protein